MANELAVSYTPGATVYAILWRISDNYVRDVGDTAWEAAGTWNAARIDECDIAMTDRGGGYYTANLPSGITLADGWRAVYYEKTGAAFSATEQPIGRTDSRTAWLQAVMEGDYSIDTDTTPWDLVVKIKGTDTELIRKELTDISGDNLTAASTIIGAATEPS